LTRSLGRPRRRGEDIIRMDLRETAWESVDWTHMDQNIDEWRAVVNTIMNPRVPYKAWNVLSSFSRKTASRVIL